MLADVHRLYSLRIPRGIKVISLDLFDTVLIRKADPPDRVSRLAAESFIYRSKLSIPVADFLSARRRAKDALRQGSLKRGFDPEYSIDEMSRVLAAEFSLPEQSCADLIEAEICAELSFIAPMPGIRRFLEEVQENYRLVIASDMYLTANHLSRLLHSVGLHNFFSDIYVSGDWKMSKSTGNLFSSVIKKEQINPSELLHIGDNILSDYFKPKSLGIKSILLYEKTNLRRKKNIRLLEKLGEESEFWKGYAPLYSIISSANGSVIEGPLYDWGKNFIGPLVTVFTHLLFAEIVKNNIREVYFMARDGFLLRKLFKLFLQKYGLEKEIRTKYIYVSRFSSFFPSERELTARDLTIAIRLAESVKEIFDRVHVSDTDVMLHFLRKHAIAASDNPKDVKDKLMQLFKDPDFAARVAENTKKPRQLFESYLDQIGFFSGSVKACVDIGWRGVTQDCIVYSFKDKPGFSHPYGYYLALNAPVYNNSSSKKGLLYDYRNASYPEEMYLSFLKEAFEMSCRGLHGSTIGYKRDSSGTVLPILGNSCADRAREKKMVPQILKIQKGVLGFAEEYIKLDQIMDINPDGVKPSLIKWFDAFLSNPDKRYITAMKSMFYTDDFGTSRFRPIIISLSPSDIFHINTFIRNLLKTPWREASLSSLRIPFLVAIYNYTKRFVCWRRIRYPHD